MLKNKPDKAFLFMLMMVFLLSLCIVSVVFADDKLKNHVDDLMKGSDEAKVTINWREGFYQGAGYYQVGKNGVRIIVFCLHKDACYIAPIPPSISQSI